MQKAFHQEAYWSPEPIWPSWSGGAHLLYCQNTQVASVRMHDDSRNACLLQHSRDTPAHEHFMNVGGGRLRVTQTWLISWLIIMWSIPRATLIWGCFYQIQTDSWSLRLLLAPVSEMFFSVLMQNRYFTLSEKRKHMCILGRKVPPWKYFQLIPSGISFPVGRLLFRYCIPKRPVKYWEFGRGKKVILTLRVQEMHF